MDRKGKASARLSARRGMVPGVTTFVVAEDRTVAAQAARYARKTLRWARIAAWRAKRLCQVAFAEGCCAVDEGLRRAVAARPALLARIDGPSVPRLRAFCFQRQPLARVPDRGRAQALGPRIVRASIVRVSQALYDRIIAERMPRRVAQVNCATITPVRRRFPSHVTFLSAGTGTAAIALALLLGPTMHNNAPAADDVAGTALSVQMLELRTEMAGVEPNLAPAVAVAAPMPPVAPALTPETPAPVWMWRKVRRPMPIYNLEIGDLDPASLVYEVALGEGENRHDGLTWRPAAGEHDLTAPFVHVAIERHPAGVPEPVPLVQDVARRVAAHGASVERLAVPTIATSKFGPIEAADAVLGFADGSRRSCLALRRIEPAGLAITGWYCGRAGQPVDRLTLSCWLDRLDLVSAGNDIPLRRLFAVAERSRGRCPSLREPGRRANWLEANSRAPALKAAGREAKR